MTRPKKHRTQILSTINNQCHSLPPHHHPLSTERVCRDLIKGAKDENLRVKGPVRLPTKVCVLRLRRGVESNHIRSSVELSRQSVRHACPVPLLTVVALHTVALHTVMGRGLSAQHRVAEAAIHRLS